MANAGGAGQGRHAHESNHLTFGHFGTATFDEDRREWSFLRTEIVNDDDDDEDNITDNEADNDGPQDASSPFEVVRALTEVVAGAASPADVLESRLKGTSFRAMAKYLPQTTAAGYLKGADVSVDHAAHHEDGSAPSGLHSFGVAFGGAVLLGDDGLQSDLRSVPICANVLHHTSNAVVFSCLKREELSYYNERSSRVDVSVPSLASVETTTWFSSSKITGVFVSERGSSQKDTRFAVSSIRGTSLLQPLFRTIGSLASLDAGSCLEIPRSRTGDASHAHLAFHPQSAEMLAIVDTAGNWSVWKVSGKRSSSARESRIARLLATGSLPQSNPSPNTQVYPHGWHRICWLSSTGEFSDQLLICNRLRACIFNIQGSFVGSPDLRFRARRGDSILEIKPSKDSLYDCFILTTSRMLWMTTQPNSKPSSAVNEPLRLVVSWNHFRSHGDESLSMHTLNLRNNFYIILTSALTSIMTVYQTFTSFDSSRSVSDPIKFDLETKPNRPHWYHFESVQTERISHPSSGLRHSFFTILQQNENGSLQQAFCRLKKHGANYDPFWDRFSILLPSKRLKGHRSARIVDDRDDFDFVIPDSAPDADRISPFNFQPRLPSTRPKKPSKYSFQAHIKDFSLIYNDLVQESFSEPNNTDSGLHHFLDEVNKTAFAKLESGLPQALLADFCQSGVRVAEIEDDSEKLSSWTKNLGGLTNTTSPDADAVFRALQMSDKTLIETYHKISDEWVQPLPVDFPPRMRFQRERLARQVALSLSLSDTIVSSGAHPIAASLEKLDLNNGSSIVVPSSPFRGPFSDDTSPPMSSQSAFMSSQTSISNDLDATSNHNAIPLTSLLSSYTTFKTPTAAAPSSTSIVSDIISHLPSSIDIPPSTYSYQTTELALNLARTEREAQESDPRTRRRAEKAARAQRKKLERQEQARKVTFSNLESVPVVLSSSQVVPHPLSSFSSSQQQQPHSLSALAVRTRRDGANGGGINSNSQTNPGSNNAGQTWGRSSPGGNGAVPESTSIIGSSSQVMPGVSMSQPVRGPFGNLNRFTTAGGGSMDPTRKKKKKSGRTQGF